MAGWRLALSGPGCLAVAGGAAAGTGPHPAIAAVAGHREQDRGAAATTALAGYIWSGDVNGYYVYNSAGGGASSTFQGPPNGSQVTFPKLQGLRNGVVQTTTYMTQGNCRDNGWRPAWVVA